MVPGRSSIVAAHRSVSNSRFAVGCDLWASVRTDQNLSKSYKNDPKATLVLAAGTSGVGAQADTAGQQPRSPAVRPFRSSAGRTQLPGSGQSAPALAAIGSGGKQTWTGRGPTAAVGLCL